MKTLGFRVAMGVLAALLATAGASAAATPPQTAPGIIQGRSSGAILTDPKGITFYFYDRDSPYKSNCYDACAASWPPVLAPPNAKPEKPWSVIRRRDGTSQWAYLGKPVYEWKNERTAGSRAAVPITDHWHVAHP
jgi:predicted lipoprotein with Yx(FWY)xxD motif